LKLGIQVSILIVTLNIFTPLFATESSLGGTAILAQPVGARQIAMGEAFVAVADDLNTIYYNPAGLAKIQNEVSMTYLQGLVDTCYASLSFGRRIKPLTSLGLSLYLFQGGTFEVPQDNSTYRMIRIQDDYLLTFSYAASNFDKDLLIGTNFKLLHSTLIEKYSATAFAGDFGILYLPDLLRGVSIGGVIQNIGTELKYVDVGDPLPLTYRLGIGYKFPGRLSGLKIDIDYVKLLNSPSGINTGIEYFPMENLGFRAGYRMSESNNYLSVGLGFAFNGIGFDYSQSLMSDFQALNQTTFSMGPGSWLFGKTNPSVAGEESYKAPEKTSFINNNIGSLLDKSLSDQIEESLRPIFVYISEGYYKDAGRELAILISQKPDNKTWDKIAEKLGLVANVVPELTGDDLMSVIVRKGLLSFLKPVENPPDALVKIHYAMENSMDKEIFARLYSVLKNYYPELAKTDEIPAGFTLITYKLYKSLNFIYDGHYDSAIKEANEVLDLEPDNILALKRLGSALYCLGKAENKPEAVEKARDIWRRVIKLSIDDKEIKEFLEQK